MASLCRHLKKTPIIPECINIFNILNAAIQPRPTAAGLFLPCSKPRLD